jgi:hypothetical protein
MRSQCLTPTYQVYYSALEHAFGSNVDYAMLAKLYGHDQRDTEATYSPAKVMSCRAVPISGNPEPEHISTSYVERQNLTMRMSMRRFARITNTSCKKVEHHIAALPLYFMSYMDDNSCRIHQTVARNSRDGSGHYRSCLENRRNCWVAGRKEDYRVKVKANRSLESRKSTMSIVSPKSSANRSLSASGNSRLSAYEQTASRLDTGTEIQAPSFGETGLSVDTTMPFNSLKLSTKPLTRVLRPEGENNEACTEIFSARSLLTSSKASFAEMVFLSIRAEKGLIYAKLAAKAMPPLAISAGLDVHSTAMQIAS